jgi:hypothetical protein
MVLQRHLKILEVEFLNLLLPVKGISKYRFLELHNPTLNFLMQISLELQ